MLHQRVANRLIEIIKDRVPDSEVFYSNTRGDQVGQNCWFIVGGEAVGSFSEERLSAARSRQDETWTLSAWCFSPSSHDTIQSAEETLIAAVNPLRDAVADSPRLSFTDSDGNDVAPVDGLRWCRLTSLSIKAGDSDSAGFVSTAELRFSMVGSAQ